MIDWQSTCIEPIFVYANDVLDLLVGSDAHIPILKTLMRGGGDDRTKKSSKKILVESLEEEAAREKDEGDVEMCQQTLSADLRSYPPRLPDKAS